jgi:hypothetical protein
MLATVCFSTYQNACHWAQVVKMTLQVLACIIAILVAMYVVVTVVTLVLSAFVLYVLPVVIVVGKLSIVGGGIKCFLSFAAI